MFPFVKQIFVSAVTFFGCDLSNLNSLKCILISNQECKVKPEIININSNDPPFFPYKVNINKCSDSCNNISDPHTKCVFLMLLQT